MGKKNRQKAASKPARPVPDAAELPPVRWWPSASWVIGLALLAIYAILPFWRFPREASWFTVVPWLLLPGALLVGWCARPLKLPAWRWSSWRRPEWANRWDLAAIGGLLTLLVAVHYRYLVQAFTWQGDEEFFVNRYMWMVRHFGPTVRERYWVLLLVILAVAGIGWWVRTQWRRNVVPLLVVVGAIVAGMVMLTDVQVLTDYYLVRYPPLLSLLEMVFANTWFGTFYAEPAHRLAAFVPMVLALVAVYVWLRHEALSIPVSLGASLVLAFMPMVHYQSTLLHIEPLVLLWMTGILYLAWRYRADDPLNSLYLVAVLTAIGGLIKETALPFMLAAWLWLALALIARRDLGWGRRLAHGARFLVICFLPSVPYLLWRSMPRGDGPDQRPYGGNVENLVSSEVYSNYLHSLIHYMTIPMALAALVGLVWLLKRRRHGGAAILALIATVGYVMFFAMDDAVYVGYVRFMTHFWPFFVVGLAGLLVALQETDSLPGKLKARPVQLVILVVLLGVNLVFHPPAPADRGAWGRLDVDGHERHFPINEALSYIHRELPGVPVVLFGHKYPYYHIGFYLQKYQLRMAPPGQLINFERAVLLYHRMADADPLADDLPGLDKRAEFQLGPRGYVVYEYNRPAASPAP